MVLFLLGCAAAIRRTSTPAARDTVGIGQQVAAEIACLVLTAVTGVFSLYAMPGTMVTAVFGFAVTRPPFVGSVGLGIFYCVAFVAAASLVGIGPDLAVQTALVVMTAVGACVGAYLLEGSQRETFAQRRFIDALSARVEALLRQYLSPSVAETLIDDPTRSALGGEVAEVTVLFADLRAYTAFAERTPPDEVVAMLNSAFGATVPIILAEGGTVIQFMGDALMAVFNAPRPQPDHALRAARASLAMQAAVAALHAAAPGERPRFRVGVNTGPALVGNIGADEVRNFSAVGDTTNLAARLQTFAAEGSVVIGERTYELVRDVADVRPLGAPELRGKSVPVAVYELLALKQER